MTNILNNVGTNLCYDFAVDLLKKFTTSKKGLFCMNCFTFVVDLKFKFLY